MTDWRPIYTAKCDALKNHPEGAYLWFKHQPDSSGTAQHFGIGTEGGLIPPPPQIDAFSGNVAVYFDGALVGKHEGIFNTAITVPDGVTVDLAKYPVGSQPAVHPDKQVIIKATIKSAIGPTAPEAGKAFEFTLKWYNQGNQITNFNILAQIIQGVVLVDDVEVELFNVPIGGEQQTQIGFSDPKTTIGAGKLKFYIYQGGKLIAETTEDMDFRKPEAPPPPTPPPTEPPVEPPTEDGLRQIKGMVRDALTNTTLGAGLTVPKVCFEGKCVDVNQYGWYYIKDPAFSTAILKCTAFGFQDWEQWVEAPMSGIKRVDINLLPGGVTPPPTEPPVEPPTPPPEPPPETVEASFESIIGGLWNAIVDGSFAIVNSAYTALTGTPITQENVDAWATQTDWLLPVNFMSKALYGKSIYKGESAAITEKDVLDLVLKEASWAILGAGVAKIGASLVGRMGATKAVSTMGKVGQLTLTGSRLRTKKYMIQGALNGMWEAIKKQPIITIFAITEFPQLLSMSVFARQTLAEEAGIDATSLNFKLADYNKAIETHGYTIRDLLADKKYNEANNALNNLKTTLDNYEFAIEANSQKLNQMDAYTNEIDLLTAYKDSYNKMREEVPFIPAELPEHMGFTVLGITDGDTVTGKSDDGTAFIIRLSGIDAPENKTAAGKAATQYLQSLVLNKEVTLDIDPEHRTDKYGRLLARVMLGPMNVNLELIKKGHAAYWVYEPNKYVDDKLYQDAAGKPSEPGLPPTAPPGAPPSEAFLINVTSEPNNAKLWLDGIDLHHRAPMDQEELARGPYYTIDLFTVGQHKLMATKAGQTAEKIINVTAGDNGVHHLVLGSGMAVPTPPPAAPDSPEQILAGLDTSQLQALLAALLKLLGQ